MKKIFILTILSISSIAYAEDGVYLGISGGLGTYNTLSSSNNWSVFNDSFGARVNFGDKIDSYFGAEIGYSLPDISNNNNYNLDVLLQLYQHTSSNWDFVYAIGPYYNNFVSGVGVALSFGTNYYFQKNVAWTINDYLYINPNVQGNYGSLSPYILNNMLLTGLRFEF